MILNDRLEVIRAQIIYTFRSDLMMFVPNVLRQLYAGMVELNVTRIEIAIFYILHSTQSKLAAVYNEPWWDMTRDIYGSAEPKEEAEVVSERNLLSRSEQLRYGDKRLNNLQIINQLIS